MNGLMDRVFGSEADHAVVKDYTSLLEQQAVMYQAMLAEQDAKICETQAVVRAREAVVRERETVVREREAEINALRAGRDAPGRITPPPGGDLADCIRAVLPQLEGWCSLQKALWLAELVTKMSGTRIGEIGVYGGKSLIPMALAARNRPGAMVYAIEPWSNSVAVEQATSGDNDQWWREVDLNKVKLGFISAVMDCGLAGVVKLIELPSDEARCAFQAMRGYRFDLLHIDGSHAEGQALADVKDWLPLMAPDGILVLDDIGWETVTKARDYLCAACDVIGEVSEGSGVSYGAYRTRQAPALAEKPEAWATLLSEVLA
ncbi:class I SAM-dependent methyltransferase [Acidocella sp.]|uniref:class I SAM-dependent methyltransferase n=1 Tax=Acidocella sp. TaxID=50710 RepID=UPI00185239F4|nr:class I SAM-dependent methyltransferase [Acidocella sp.]NNM56981.1 class I SAM-dependent methyltransferase [Acidocella sp.]